MTMEIKAIESSKDIEKEFTIIKEEINKIILSGSGQVPSQEQFDKLDLEFQKVKKKYEENNDKLNLYFVFHDYYYRKLFQFLDTDTTKSLELYFTAVKFLLKRNEIKPIRPDIFEKMLKTYEVGIIKISERSEKIDFNKLEPNFFEFINTFLINR